MKTTYWHYKDGLKVCDKCNSRNRNYFHGTLDPKSKTGMGVISEYIVAKVLNDCIKCNTSDNFCASYDLVSASLGTINVKSSKLHITHQWIFSRHKNNEVPNYYICIGFDDNRTEILHVWIIPGNSEFVSASGVFISLNNLDNIVKYEIDSNQYNKVYQNLELQLLPEFENVL